jgi:hypothetical protein
MEEQWERLKVGLFMFDSRRSDRSEFRRPPARPFFCLRNSPDLSLH